MSDHETSVYDPQTAHLLSLFAYEHLPERLQAVSRIFHYAAHRVVELVPSNAERTIALRNLWDAKNYAVVAAGIAAGIPAPKQAERLAELRESASTAS